MPPATSLQSLTQADLEMFSRIGVDGTWLEAAQIRRVTDREAREYGITFNPKDVPPGYKPDLSGILFPYSHPLTGQRLTGRLRRDHPDSVNGKPKAKYVRAYGDNHHLFFPPGSGALLKDIGPDVVLVEAEKSALALSALAQRSGRVFIPIACGGCWGWMGKTGIETLANGDRQQARGPSPDFSLFSCQGRRVVIIFDSNVATNSKVRDARGRLAEILSGFGARVFFVDLPAGNESNGPDDFIGLHGDEAMLALLHDAKPFVAPARTVHASKSGLSSEDQPQWPEPLDAAAFHGPAGELCKAVSDYSEADEAGILFQEHVVFGSLVGPKPHFRVGWEKHHLTEFLALGGNTAVGAKGMSLVPALELGYRIDPEWYKHCRKSGLSSGEGLISAVRDANKDDPGVTDKRLLVIETEFGKVLAVMGREHNILSAVIRQAFETGHLQTITKNPTTATGAHISLIVHVTKEELTKRLTENEQCNGFANRFLWVCVRLSKLLPGGPVVPDQIFDGHVKKFKEALEFSKTVDEMKRDPEADEGWNAVYEQLRIPSPGLAGMMAARAPVHVMRLACIYALLDKAPLIRQAHLKAALALWEYCAASIRFLFGEAIGDKTADKLDALLKGYPTGLTKTEINDLLGGHYKSPEIDRGLGLLAKYGRAKFTETKTRGRTEQKWIRTLPNVKN
jgi:hypothetical protein